MTMTKTRTESRIPIKNFRDLVTNHGPWVRRNFGDTNGLNEIAQLMGIGEEYLGELGESSQSMVYNEKDIEAGIDGYVDTLVFLAAFFYFVPLSSQGLTFDPFKMVVPAYENSNPVVHYGHMLHHALKHKQRIRGYDNYVFYIERLQESANKFYTSLITEFNDFLDDAELYGGKELKSIQEYVEEIWNRDVCARDWVNNPQDADEVVRREVQAIKEGDKIGRD